MRASHRLSAYALGAATALVVAGCAGPIEIRTMAAPETALQSFRTFRMLPGPARRDGRAASGVEDPMISNSIANRAIRDQVRRAFQDRGYSIDNVSPDFTVAFYAAAREKLDLSAWDYGYPAVWRNPGMPRPTPMAYTEGSVVVDVIDPRDQQLLWRGEGRAALTDDPAENLAQLVKVAEKIVGKFPKSSPRIVAERP